jgi:hypothetical protein
MNKIDTNMYGSYPYYINLIIRPPTPKNSINDLKNLYINLNQKQKQNKSDTNLTLPPKIDINKIYLISDINYLSQLEIIYDNFLNKNHHLLALYELIDDMLDIRDALTIQVSKLKRKAEKNILLKENINANTNVNNNENIDDTNYNYNYNKYLPIELCLTQEQLKQGYTIMSNEPKEYKCGCETIRYTTNNKGKNSNNKILKKALFCNYHNNLKRKEKILTTELKIIRKEIVNIKRDTNSIDFDIQSCKMIQNKNICKSKYPWKQ